VGDDRADVDAGEELGDAVGDVESFVVVDVVLGVHEVLPLGLGLVAWGGVVFVVVELEVFPLPLAVLSALLDVGDEGAAKACCAGALACKGCGLGCCCAGAPGGAAVHGGSQEKCGRVWSVYWAAGCTRQGRRAKTRPQRNGISFRIRENC